MQILIAAGCLLSACAILALAALLTWEAVGGRLKISKSNGTTVHPWPAILLLALIGACSLSAGLMLLP